MSDVSAMALLVKHFDPNNVTDVLDIRNRVLPALECEKRVMYDLYQSVKGADDEAAEDYMASLREIGAYIRMAREKIAQVVA